MTRDLRTLQNLELREENIGLESSWDCKRMHAIGGEAVEADAIGEQQLKWTQAASMREQQLKRMQSGQGAAADSKWTQAVNSS